MKRLILLLLMAGFSLGAAPAGQIAREILPIPPIPPDMPSTLEAAPVPNSRLSAPVTAHARGPEVTPTVMSPKRIYQGEGFLAGSAMQSEQQRKARPAPGLNLTVPLQ
jgi:hypothetical protein